MSRRKIFANTVAGIIIAIGMVAGGGFLIFNMLTNMSDRSSVAYRNGSFDWTIFIVFVALGLLLIVMGGALGWWLMSLLRTKMSLGENGICVSEPGGQKVLLWDQITKITKVHILPKQHGRGLAATAIHAMDYVVVTYEVTRFDNEIFAVSENLIGNISQRVATKNVEWATEER